MLIPVKCTSAMSQISPKPEDNYTTYRFGLDGPAPQGHEAEYIDGGYWLNHAEAGKFTVGKPYNLHVTVTGILAE